MPSRLSRGTPPAFAGSASAFVEPSVLQIPRDYESSAVTTNSHDFPICLDRRSADAGCSGVSKTGGNEALRSKRHIAVAVGKVTSQGKRMKWVRNMKVLGLDLISGCSSG